MTTLKVILIDSEVEDVSYLSRFFVNGNKQIDLEHFLTVEEVDEFLANYTSGSTTQFDLPAFVVIDIDFPKAESGLALLKRIKQNRHFEQIPVFVFTNNNNKDAIAHSYVNGANGYFLKPENGENLSESLKMLTGRWQQIIQRGFGYNYQAV